MKCSWDERKQKGRHFTVSMRENKGKKAVSFKERIEVAGA